MFFRYKTQGLCIKKIDRGEADQLLVFYTKDYGKLEILGRAIRKIKSKLRGGAELFYLSEIEFIQGKTYKTLTDAVLINSFQNIRNDFEKLKIIYKISEDLDNLIKGQEPDQEIWELLNEVFTKLNNWKIENSLKIENCKLKIIYYYFFWNFISILGYQPRIKDFYIFYGNKKEKINVDLFKILRIIFKKDIKILLKLKLESSHQKSLKDISQKYFDYVFKEC